MGTMAKFSVSKWEMSGVGSCNTLLFMIEYGNDVLFHKMGVL